jgi:DNA mismatch repair protein MutS2
LFKTREEAEYELERVEVFQKLGVNVQLSIPAEPQELTRLMQTVSFVSAGVLVRLKDWFEIIHVLRKAVTGNIMTKYFNVLGNYDEIEHELKKTIDGSGAILDTASPHLRTIRAKKQSVERSIQRIMKKLLSDRSYLFSDNVIVKRNGHYVMPVKRNFKSDLPGAVHAYSNSGETVFVEPLEVTDHTAELLELEEFEKEEIEQILRALTDNLRPLLPHIEQDINVVIDLDIVCAKIRYAQELGATMPCFAEDLVIVNGFHPMLRRVCENVVPLNVRMTRDQPILLISGPNAGGKTVVLKTVGVIALMAKCGMLIPVEEGSRLPFFDTVYADIGDEQSIESQMSTFAAHLVQLKGALNADSQSLVLLDELMSQTSVEEGSALAMAFLDTFAEKKCWVLATTHNENLKLYASSRSEMQNGGMEYTDHPTYRLILGIPQPSNAVRLAQTVGINHGIIDRARSYMDKEKIGFNELFEDLSKQLKSIEKDREQLSRLVNEYETKLADFNVKRKSVLEDLKATYKRDMIQAKRSVEKLIKDLKKQGATPAKVHESRRFFAERLVEKAEHEPYHPTIGEIVRIRELNKNGQVIEEHGGQYKVSLDTIFYWVDPKDIEAVK